MKKTLLVLLVLALVVSSAFCASSKKFSKYETILKSGEYTLTGAMHSLDFSGNPIKSDGGSVIISEHAGQYYLEMTEGYETMKILIKDGKTYTIDESSRMCMVSPADDSDASEFIIDTDFDVMESGNGKFDGKTLSYEKAQKGNVTTTYWYNGNDLYAIATVESGSYGDRSVLIIDSLKSGADASRFEVPEDYEILDLTVLYSWGADDYDFSSLFADYDDSDWYSDYDYSDWYSDYDYDWDWDYAEPDYYALGRLFGLSDSQASNFSYAVELLEYIDWDALQSYYNSDTYTYDMTTKDFQNANYFDSYDIAQLQKLINAFK